MLSMKISVWNLIYVIMGVWRNWSDAIDLESIVENET